MVSIFLCSSCFDRYENRNKFYKLAQESFENEHYEDSLLHIKNALRIDPQFISGYVLLGKIAFENKKFNDSKKNYLKAFKIDPDSVEVNLGLAKSYIYLNQYHEASQYIKNVISIDPENNVAKFFQGILFFHEQRFEDSLKILLSIPQSELTIDGYIFITQNYMKLGDPISGINCLLQGLSLNGENNFLHFALARVYESINDLDNALIHYKYVDIHGQGIPAYRYALSDFYLRYGYVNDAEALLTDLIHKSYDIHALKTLSDLLIYEKKFENAERIILDYEVQYSEKKDLKLFLIEFYINQGKFERARQKLENELSSESSLSLKNTYRKLLIQIFKITNENEKVSEYMARILRDDPSDSDALLFFAQKDSLEGSFDQAIFKFRQVIHLEPDKDRSYLALAHLYLARSDYIMARQVLFECIQNNKSSAARILLSRIFEKSNQVDNAIEQLRMIPDVFKSRIDLFSHLIKLEMKNNDFLQVEKDLITVFDHKPYRYFSQLTLSKLYSLQGLFDKAHSIINQAIQEDNTQIPFFEQKISIFLDQKKNSDASNFIDNHVADESIRLFLHGELLLASNDINNATSMLKKSIDIKENRYVFKKLLHLYIKNAQISHAIGIAKHYIKSHENDFQILFLLGYLHEQSNAYQNAAAFYKRSLQSNPNYFPAANNLAYLYAEKFPTRSNLEYALNLIEQGLFVANSQSLDTLGWVYSQLGDIKHSLAIFEILASWPDVSPVVFYHLGATYMRDGQAERAREWLTKSVNAHSDFPEKKNARKLLNEIAG